MEDEMTMLDASISRIKKAMDTVRKALGTEESFEVVGVLSTELHRLGSRRQNYLEQR